MPSSTEATEAKPRAGEDASSSWDVIFKWLAVYHVPIRDTPYQENVSLVRPSPKLREVTDHIRTKLEEIGEVTLATNPDIYPPIYRIQEPGGNCWAVALPILLNDPPRPYDDVYDFVLPELNP